MQYDSDVRVGSGGPHFACRDGGSDLGRVGNLCHESPEGLLVAHGERLDPPFLRSLPSGASALGALARALIYRIVEEKTMSWMQ